MVFCSGTEKKLLNFLLLPESEQQTLRGTGTPLKFNSVDFRDGQQSLFATRLTTADMIPLLEQMDAVGYDSMECGAALPSMWQSVS